MMVELKPCPFCGMKRFLRHSDFHGCDVWDHPKNDDCFFSEMYFMDRPDLVEKWNTRKEPKRCCGNCKHYSEDMCIREFVRDPFHYGSDVCEFWEMKE